MLETKENFLNCRKSYFCRYDFQDTATQAVQENGKSIEAARDTIIRLLSRKMQQENQQIGSHMGTCLFKKILWSISMIC